MKTLKHFLYLSITTFMLFACGNNLENPDKKTDFIEISNQQFTSNDMQLGKADKRVFENIVKSNGMIITLPGGNAKVNAPINGLISNIYINNGQFVQKNQVLLEIGGIEIIDLQKEFAIASANLKRLKTDYERIKLLFDEKATSEKEFILAEAEYKATLANYNGLKLKIESVGLSSSKIENGDFYTSYLLKSPINGYIFNLKAFIGSNVGVQNELLEIVNTDLLQVKLSVFSDDISKIKAGQEVRVKISGSNNSFYGKINAVGVAFDDDTKSIPCFASVSDKKLVNPIANMYVEADIITGSDTVNALPKSALIKSENSYYILLLNKQDSNKYSFTKQAVSIGREYKDFCEILENISDGLILTKGGYYIAIDQ